MQFAKVFLFVLSAMSSACARSALPRKPLLSVAASPVSAEPAESTDTKSRADYTQLLQAAQQALDAGHADAAATLAADACRLDDTLPEAFVVHGLALAQHDDVAQSSVAFERARALGTRDAALFVALASNYDIERRYTEAVSVYLDYLTDHPHDAVMRDELALTYLLMGDVPNATAQLRAALRNAPGNAQVRQDLGYARLMAKDFAEAEALLHDVCAQPAATFEAPRLYAQALAGLRKWPEALAVVDAFLVAHPSDALAQTLRRALEAHLAPGTQMQATDTATPP